MSNLIFDKIEVQSKLIYRIKVDKSVRGQGN